MMAAAHRRFRNATIVYGRMANREAEEGSPWQLQKYPADLERPSAKGGKKQASLKNRSQSWQAFIRRTSAWSNAA